MSQLPTKLATKTTRCPIAPCLPRWDGEENQETCQNLWVGITIVNQNMEKENWNKKPTNKNERIYKVMDAQCNLSPRGDHNTAACLLWSSKWIPSCSLCQNLSVPLTAAHTQNTIAPNQNIPTCLTLSIKRQTTPASPPFITMTLYDIKYPFG